MKSPFIIALLSLCACATGVVDPIEESEEKVIKSLPQEASEEDNNKIKSDCIVEAYWAGNCLVKKVSCKDKEFRVDVSCDKGRPLFPWEYIPDPPPDFKSKY